MKKKFFFDKNPLFNTLTIFLFVSITIKAKGAFKIIDFCLVLFFLRNFISQNFFIKKICVILFYYFSVLYFR